MKKLVLGEVNVVDLMKEQCHHRWRRKRRNNISESHYGRDSLGCLILDAFSEQENESFGFACFVSEYYMSKKNRIDATN
jgi:hypothetical protein